MAFSFALLGWSLIKVLAPGYYARQDTKGPVKVAMRALGLTMAAESDRRRGCGDDRRSARSPGTHALLALRMASARCSMRHCSTRTGAQAACLRAGQAAGTAAPDRVASAVMAAFLLWLGGDVGWLDRWPRRLLRIVWLTRVGDRRRASSISLRAAGLLGVRRSSSDATAGSVAHEPLDGRCKAG